MLSPAVKTTITGEGSVVFHDETRYGLRRLCVASYSKYPDLEMWMGMLRETADVRSHRYVEKEIKKDCFAYYLWLYWKETP
jgi:hypothetical protein